MKLIPLTQGKFAKVDDEDYEMLSQFKWYPAPRADGNCYVICTYHAGIRQSIYLHRKIMNAGKDMLVDHVNGDGLDNQKKNLRIATPKQNSQNRKPVKRRRGTLKGTQYTPESSKKNPWKANFWNGKKMIGLGYYSTELEAHEAYKKEAQKLHGQFYYET